MALSFTVSGIVSASPGEVYNAWLDSIEHTNMTGSPAQIDSTIGNDFTAHDDYITGKNLELDHNKRILQSWRTSHFDESEPDSVLEVIFESVDEGCKITINHSNLPPHGTQYETGWVTHYIEPMQKYFGDQD